MPINWHQWVWVEEDKAVPSKADLRADLKASKVVLSLSRARLLKANHNHNVPTPSALARPKAWKLLNATQHAANQCRLSHSNLDSQDNPDSKWVPNRAKANPNKVLSSR